VGVRFARLAIALSAGVTMLTALTQALPPSAPPGLATPMLLAALAWDGAWILYLTLLDQRSVD